MIFYIDNCPPDHCARDNKTYAHLNEQGGLLNPKNLSFGNTIGNNNSNEMDQRYPKQNVIGNNWVTLLDHFVWNERYFDWIKK